MSKLDELIKKYCPDGVEYKKLGDIAHYSTVRIDTSSIDTTNYVGVENLLPNKQGKTLATSIPTTGNVIEFKSGDVLIGNIRPYLRKIWLANCNGGTNGDVLTIQINSRSQILPDFLYYILSSEAFFNYDNQNSKGAKMPRGDKLTILKYAVPVPPLPVQEEIVRILDSFTSLTAELQAELQARKKQYEYYRNILYTKHDYCPKKKLIDISDISRGIRVVKKNLIDDGKFPVYQNSLTPMGYYNKSNVTENTTYVISAGAAGEIGFCNTNFWAADDCLVFSNLKEIRNKYIYYFLLTKQDFIRSNVRKASVPRLSRTVIENLQIPIISLEEQDKILSLLDRFDTICNDITTGLPAEIAARQKQYEYYRDKLLTFKELS